MLTAQSLVRSVPDWPVPAIVQFGTESECKDMILLFWLLVCSMMSTSPVVGQTPLPRSQNAGQVPQLQSRQSGSGINECITQTRRFTYTSAGTCPTSSTNKP